MSKIGERKNSGKLRWRNFPMFLMEPLVEVGAAAEKHPGNPNGKYDTFNFLAGMGVNDCLDCAKRHLMKAESPYHDDYDDDLKELSGKDIHHLALAAWNLLVALHNIKTRPDLDDRYKTMLVKEAESEVIQPTPILTRCEFQVGDLVKTENGDIVYEVSAVYYTEELKPVMMIRDANHNIFGVNPLGYVKYGGSVNI